MSKPLHKSYNICELLWAEITGKQKAVAVHRDFVRDTRETVSYASFRNWFVHERFEFRLLPDLIQAMRANDCNPDGALQTLELACSSGEIEIDGSLNDEIFSLGKELGELCNHTENSLRDLPNQTLREINIKASRIRKISEQILAEAQKAMAA